MFITVSTSLGLIGVGLATTLSEIVSTNLYRSYSSIIDSDKIVVSNKTPNTSKDIITSASFNEVKEIMTQEKIENYGVYYWNVGDIFQSNNYICLDTFGSKRPFGNINCNHINEFALLETNKNEIYPKKSEVLADNEVILSIPMLTVDEICYQLQIPRTIDSLANYIDHHEVNMTFCLSNDSWGYSVDIPLSLKGFILSSKTLIYHSNRLWNQIMFETNCQLPVTSYINVNTSHLWDLKKSYYIELNDKRDDFLIRNRFSSQSETLDYELMDKKYCPLLYEDMDSFMSNRALVVHRTNKDYIPSYLGEHFKKVSKGIYEITYGSEQGYSIYEQSLMMGFSKLTLLSSSEDELLDIVDDLTYIKYEDSINVVMPSQIVEGHYSKSSLNGFVFEPHYSLITGRKPVNFQEILVSTSLIQRLKISDPLNKMIYLSFPVKEDLLSNGYLSREYKTVGLKIVGITDSGKASISHDESWTILFFQTMLGVSTFDLRINSLAIRVNESNQGEIIKKISRAFPTLTVDSPLTDAKESIDKICNYIEIIMLAVSITSVIIAALILFICNYLHFEESKKDIGLVRCLGVKEKESRKFIYSHSFVLTGISLTLSIIELLVISLILSKALSETLYIESMFVFNPFSILYMVAVALFISFISSILISSRISKIDALSCLK